LKPFWLSIVTALMAFVFLLAGLYTWTHPQIVIHWSAPASTGIIGFNLYRTQDINQEFVRINPEMIEASDVLSGNPQYHYLDKKSSAGKYSYYLVEEIHANGLLQRSAPIEVMAGRTARILLIIGAMGIAISICLLFLGQTKQSFSVFKVQRIS
jgi:hypothetical protein